MHDYHRMVTWKADIFQVSELEMLNLPPSHDKV